MYKSPIELIESDFEVKTEDMVYKAVQQVGVRVDREELLRALMYDRGQYDKGYEDGLEDGKKYVLERIKEIYG